MQHPVELARGHPSQLGDLLLQLRLRSRGIVHAHTKPVCLFQDMLPALIVGMIRDQERTVQLYTLQTRFLAYLAHGALFDGLPRVQLSLGQIPDTTSQHEQVPALAIPNQPTPRFYQQEFLPEGFLQLNQIRMQKDTGVDLGLPHFVDHCIHRVMREIIDEHRIVVMGIGPDLRRHRIAQKKRFVVKVDLDVHGGVS